MKETVIRWSLDQWSTHAVYRKAADQTGIAILKLLAKIGILSENWGLIP